MEIIYIVLKIFIVLMTILGSKHAAVKAVTLFIVQNVHDCTWKVILKFL